MQFIGVEDRVGEPYLHMTSSKSSPLGFHRIALYPSNMEEYVTLRSR